jgi:hypothetical protein
MVSPLRRVGTLEERGKKTVAVIVLIVVLIVGLWTIKGWSADAFDRSQDSISKADEDYWLGEYERRADMGGYFIIGLTGIMVGLFLSGILDDEDDEMEMLTDQPLGMESEGNPSLEE